MNTANELTTVQSSAVAMTGTVGANPGHLLQIAVERGATLEQIEKLMAMQERYEANEARKAYVRDMAAFKKNPPIILKDKTVGYENSKGDWVGYTHASLGAVTNAVVVGLSEFGFSHEWDVEQGDGSLIKVTCIMTHRLGHSKRVAMEATPDNSGKKNPIQQVASTVTYLQRYTLLLSCGLATQDQMDDDARSAYAEEEKKLPQLPGDRFKNALEQIKNGKYTEQKLRCQWDLTVDQVTALNDFMLENGVAK